MWTAWSLERQQQVEPVGLEVREELGEQRRRDCDGAQDDDEEPGRHADAVGAQPLPRFVPIRLRGAGGSTLERADRGFDLGRRCLAQHAHAYRILGSSTAYRTSARRLPAMTRSVAKNVTPITVE